MQLFVFKFLCSFLSPVFPFSFLAVVGSLAKWSSDPSIPLARFGLFTIQPRFDTVYLSSLPQMCYLSVLPCLLEQFSYPKNLRCLIITRLPVRFTNVSQPHMWYPNSILPHITQLTSQPLYLLTALQQLLFSLLCIFCYCLIILLSNLLSPIALSFPP